MINLTIIGNMATDLELKYTNSGKAVASGRIATSRRFSSADGERLSDFFNVVFWAGLAEACAKYVKKGDKIGISGRLENRTYTDKQGIERITSEIIAEEVEFLMPKRDVGEHPAPKRAESKPVQDNDLPF